LGSRSEASTAAVISLNRQARPNYETRVACELNQGFTGWTQEQIQSLQPPVMLMVGDSDISRPEHSVEYFRLLGGGVIGDLQGIPRSRLAILPGTTHVTVVSRADLLLAMIPAFLDAPQAFDPSAAPTKDSRSATSAAPALEVVDHGAPEPLGAPLGQAVGVVGGHVHHLQAQADRLEQAGEALARFAPSED